jgi:Flp pilus assembly protein TadG
MAQGPGTSCIVGRCRQIKRWSRRAASLVLTQSGNSAVEFAVSAPLLLGLLTPMADLGLAYSQQIQVQQAAQAGAQYASLHPWNSNSSTAIANAATSATGLTLLPADSLTNPAPYQECRCLDGSTIGLTSCNSVPCADGAYGGYYVIVHAQAAYSPILPYSLLGDLTKLTAQATVRVH